MMDQELRNKLQNYRPVPPESLWEGIAANVSSPTPIPIWRKWWFILAIATFSTFILLFLLSVIHKSEESNQPVEEKLPPHSYLNKRLSPLTSFEQQAFESLSISNTPDFLIRGSDPSLDMSSYLDIQNAGSGFLRDKKEIDSRIPRDGKLSFNNEKAVGDSISLQSVSFVLPSYFPSTIEATVKPISIEEVYEIKSTRRCKRKNSLSFIAGLSRSYRTLESDVHHQLVDHKDNHETEFISKTIGILYNRNITNKLSIKSGIMYTSLGERYGFHHDLIAHDATNKYEYYVIPLSVTYELFRFRKWSLLTNGGIHFNILKQATSSWVDLNTLSPITHTNEDAATTPFQQKAISWNGGVIFRYQVMDKLFLQVNQQYDRFNQSIYQQDVQLNQRPLLT